MSCVNVRIASKRLNFIFITTNFLSILLNFVIKIVISSIQLLDLGKVTKIEQRRKWIKENKSKKEELT